MSTARFCVEAVRLCAHYFALHGLRSVDLQELFGQEPRTIQRRKEANIDASLKQERNGGRDWEFTLPRQGCN
jgi:hypothetical protein